jgi:hypothetical protein
MMLSHLALALANAASKSVLVPVLINVIVKALGVGGTGDAVGAGVPGVLTGDAVGAGVPGVLTGDAVGVEVAGVLTGDAVGNVGLRLGDAVGVVTVGLGAVGDPGEQNPQEATHASPTSELDPSWL